MMAVTEVPSSFVANDRDFASGKGPTLGFNRSNWNGWRQPQPLAGTVATRRLIETTGEPSVVLLPSLVSFVVVNLDILTNFGCGCLRHRSKNV